jgi:hypothetical protein
MAHLAFTETCKCRHFPHNILELRQLVRFRVRPNSCKIMRCSRAKRKSAITWFPSEFLFRLFLLFLCAFVLSWDWCLFFKACTFFIKRQDSAYMGHRPDHNSVEWNNYTVNGYDLFTNPARHQFSPDLITCTIAAGCCAWPRKVLSIRWFQIAQPVATTSEPKALRQLLGTPCSEEVTERGHAIRIVGALWTKPLWKTHTATNRWSIYSTSWRQRCMNCSLASHDDVFSPLFSIYQVALATRRTGSCWVPLFFIAPWLWAQPTNGETVRKILGFFHLFFIFFDHFCIIQKIW